MKTGPDGAAGGGERLRPSRCAPSTAGASRSPRPSV